MSDPIERKMRLHGKRMALWIAVIGNVFFWTALWGAGLELPDFFPSLSIYNPATDLCRRTINDIVKTGGQEEVVKVCQEWLDTTGRMHYLKDYELQQREGKYYVVPKGINFKLLGLLAFIAGIMILGKKTHRFLMARYRRRMIGETATHT